VDIQCSFGRGANKTL